MAEVSTDYGILVGVDGSAESDAAIGWATREATMRSVPITVMHVVPPIPEWPTPSRQSEIAEVWEQNARDVIEQARKPVVANAGESDPPDLRAEVVSSTVVPTLIDASQHARMIVMGSRGMGALGRFLLGSVSSGLVHHAHCPVAIIHADEGSADDKAPVLVGVDGVAGVRRGHRVGLRRSVASWGGSCRLARVERCGGLPDSRHGLARIRSPRRGSPGRTPGRLARTISRRAGAATARLRQTCPL